MGVLAHFAMWDILGAWGYLHFVGPRNQTRKIFKIHKNVELYQFSCYNFLCKTVLIFSIYKLFTKLFEIFWSKDITSIQGNSPMSNVLKKSDKKHFELYQVFMSWIVLEIF